MSGGARERTWVRTGRRFDPIRPRAADFYHLLVAEAPGGNAKAACGRVLVGAYDAKGRRRGHWPTEASCNACVAIAKGERE
jgi:hypothetical protein